MMETLGVETIPAGGDQYVLYGFNYDDELMAPLGRIIKISTIVEMSVELNKHICVVTRNPTGLPRGMYDLSLIHI